MATVTVSQVPKASIDGNAVRRWISGRLNDTRNRFILQMARGPGGGKVHRKGKTVHVASKAGEYPLTDSGRLWGSVGGQDYGQAWFRGTVEAEEEGPFTGSIYSNLQYASFLEEGTAHMAARRMLGDALAEMLDSRPEADELAKAAVVR
jgi:hypothetical protein